MTAPTTHRATLENGPSVVAGSLIWTSASGITVADPHSFGGCTRRWWYEKVDGKEAPETEAMRGGTALHAEVEAYLRHGTPLSTPLALAGRPFIPHPGDNLLIEKPIHFKTRDGISIYGHVDLYNFRQQYIDPEGVLQQDPPWSFEVKDWKTTASFEYAKTPAQLAENVQLNLYAEARFRESPDLEHARLTHVYFRTDKKKRPESKLVTIRRSREEIASRWEYAESVTRVMRDVSRETNVERVPANPKSCTAYRGCPHQGYCTAFHSTSLDHLYAKIADDFTRPENDMGILASNPQIMQPQAPAQQSTAPQPDMRAQLAAEEAQMRAQVAAAQAPQMNTQSLAVACQRIIAHGRGFPAIGGNAAVPYSMTLNLNQPVQPGFVFSGIGNLGSIQLNEPAHIFQLADELDAERQAPPQMAQVQQQVMQQMQPVAQQISAPTGYQPQVMQYGGQQPIAQPQAGGFLPPGAPESMPQLASQPPKPEASAQPPAAEEPKKGRGRPKKDKDAAPEQTAAAATPTVSSPPSPPVGAPAPQAAPVTTSASYGPDTSQPLLILINARSAGVATKSLAGYVDYVNGELAKRYCVNNDGSPGIQDVRCAPKDSVLSYAAWKGCVREVVKADPPPPGCYHLDTFRDELNEVVADALRVVAERAGWLYVRGVQV